MNPAWWYVFTIGALTCAPWMSVLLLDAGVAEPHVPLILGLFPLVTLTAGPLWSWVADRTGRTVSLLRMAALLHLASAALLALYPSATWVVASMLGWIVARSGVAPLGDAATLSLLGREGRNYGHFRAWGSLAYLIAMLATSSLRDTFPHGPFAVAAGLAACAWVWTLKLPTSTVALASPRWPELRALLDDPQIRLLATVCALHGATIVSYDYLYALHIKGLGHPSWVVGVSVALGVAVEVGVMLRGRYLLDRFGPKQLLLVALISGIPRWLVTGTTGHAGLLIAAQALHGVGFGAFWVAGVALFSERAPTGLTASGQAILRASTFGLGALLGMALASAALSQGRTATLFAGLSLLSALATLLWRWIR